MSELTVHLFYELIARLQQAYLGPNVYLRSAGC